MANASNNTFLISFRTLRQLIGYLGIFLPFMCWLVNTVVNHFDLLNNPAFVNLEFSEAYVAGSNLKSSISHFYYTTAGPLFTGILITVSIFLFTYNGYAMDKDNDKFAWLTDKRISSFAAICALGIVTFPSGSSHKIIDNIHIFVSSNTAGAIHLTCAALFFLSMELMSIINFRRNPGKILIKNAEVRLYLICGWGIIASILFLGINSFVPGGENWLWGKAVFIFEVFMLLFFGIAWLVKGKSIPTEFLLNKIEEEKKD